MTTTREEVITALVARLQTAQPTLGRNTPLPDLNVAATTILLKDGDIEPGDVFLNPRVFEFTATPMVLVMVVGGTDADRDASIDTITVSLIGALAGQDLGGLAFDIRPQPSNKTPKETFGAPNVTSVEFGIEIDYESDSSAG